MPNYNRIILMGNLTRDPELKHLPSGTPVVNIGVAVNRRFNDRQTGEQREETLFVDVDFFNRSAEVIDQYFEKGKPIHIEGRLRFQHWEDENGNRRSKHSVVGDRFEFVQTAAEAGATSSSNYQQGDYPPPTNQQEGANQGMPTSPDVDLSLIHI